MGHVRWAILFLFATSLAAEDLGGRVWKVLSLSDYNTLVVVLGTSLLGLAAGLVGTFLFLQKRALLGDTLAHATLPGVAGAFLVATAFGWEGKTLALLLPGAVCTGLAGVGLVQLIVRTTRLGDDAALAIVLATFFGAGLAGLQSLRGLPGVDLAGLDQFLLGHTAALLRRDAQVLAGTALLVLMTVLALRKELALLVFDRQQAQVQGWPTGVLDGILLVLTTAVVVVGLQAVGAILMVALLVIPPAAARFWTDRLGTMLVIAGGIGAGSGYLGCVPSALVAQIPAGPAVVLVATAAFAVSFLCGRRRGLVAEVLRRRRAQRVVRRQSALRWLLDPATASGLRPAVADLAALRRLGLIDGEGGLSVAGLAEARLAQRNHQLWRIFLRTHAERASARLDRELPELDRELPAELIAELEAAHQVEFGVAVSRADGAGIAQHPMGRKP